MFNRKWKWDIWFQNSFYYRRINKPSRAFAPTLVFRNVTSANWSTQATAIRVIFRVLKSFVWVMKPCQVIHLILDKTWSYVFKLLIFESVEPSVKVHESKNRKIKNQIKKKKRIEKPSFYLFPKTFTFGARLTPTKWLAFCKICFIHVGCWGTLLLSFFPLQWSALMYMFPVLLSTTYMYFLRKQPLIYSRHLVTNVLP